MVYQQFMCHALSEASNQSCNVTNCTQCSLDHELNTMDTNGPTLQVNSDPSDCFSYKGTKRDSSLEVTGRLSRLRQKKLSLVNNNSTDETGLTGLVSGDGKSLVERTSFENLHPFLVEDTENLHRRLHGTPLNGASPQHKTPQSKSPQPTRPQTTQSTSRNHTRTSQNTSSPRNRKSVRFLGPERAKSAAYHTRTSVFEDRFSPSMASTLPSLAKTSERHRKPRNRPATSKSKQKISVDTFSPI